MQAAAEQACQHLGSVATTRPEQASAALASASAPVENHVEVVADGGRQAKDNKSKLGVIVSQRTRKAITEDVLKYDVTEPRGPGQGFLCKVVVRLDGGSGSEQSFSGKICSNKKEAMQAAAEQACQYLGSVATTRPEQASAALASASAPVENHVEVVADGGRQAKDYKSKLGVIVSQRTRKAITEDVLKYDVTEPGGPGQGFLCKVVVRLDGGSGSEQSFSGKICSNKKEAMQAAAEQACQYLGSVATTRPEQASAALASASAPVENHVEVVADGGRQAKDYKSKLGVIVSQRTRKAITEDVLKYDVTEPRGPGQGFLCKVVVRLDGGSGSEQSFSGKICSNKKEAMQAAAEQACQYLGSVATTRPEQASAALASASAPVENHVEVVADGGRQAKDYKSKLGVIVSQRTRKAITEDVLKYDVTEPRGPGQGFLCKVVVRLDGGSGSEQSFSGKICSNRKEAMQAAAEQACQYLGSVATTRPEQASAALASASAPVENHVEVVADGGRQAKDYKSKLGVIVSQRTRKAITEDVLKYDVTEPRGPGQGFLCKVVVRLDGGSGSEQSFSGKICSNRKEAMQAAAEQACQYLGSVATTRPEQASAALASASAPVENHVEVVADGGRQAKDYKSKLGVIVSQRTRKAITEDVLKYDVTEPRGPGQGFLCKVVVRLDGGSGSEQSFSGKICSNRKEAMQAAAEQACQYLGSVATTRPEQASAALASASVPEALTEAGGKFSHCKVAAITLTAACIGALQGTKFQSLQPRNTEPQTHKMPCGQFLISLVSQQKKLPLAGTINGP